MSSLSFASLCSCKDQISLHLFENLFIFMNVIYLGMVADVVGKHSKPASASGIMKIEVELVVAPLMETRTQSRSWCVRSRQRNKDDNVEPEGSLNLPE